MQRNDSNLILMQDIKRSIILSQYIMFWGMPVERHIMSKEGGVVELYFFPDQVDRKIYRLATIGLSSMLCSDLRSCNSELFLAIPFSEAKENAESIKNYVFDVAAYVLNTLGRELSSGITVPSNKLAPNGWPSAILFDEPLGEDQTLSCFHIGEQHIDLIWLIPIFQSEYTVIKSQGLQRFYELDEQNEASLVDVFRAPIL